VLNSTHDAWCANNEPIPNSFFIGGKTGPAYCTLFHNILYKVSNMMKAMKYEGSVQAYAKNFFACQ